MAEENKQELKFDVDIEQLRKNGIFLGIPMYGGVLFGSVANSLIELAVMCKHFGIPLARKFLYNESLIPRARNYIVDSFMQTDMKHFVFIDADVDFTAQDILIMADLQAKNPEYNVITAAYPKKMIAWEKIINAVNKGVADTNPEILENFVGDYVFNAVQSGQIKISEPAEVAEAGTGFMMIHRETFEKFKQAYPDKSYKPDHVRTKDFDGSREIHAYFDCIIDPVSKRYLSEDYYFCHKVREAGMKVWLCPWIALAHNGYYRFGGSLAALASIGENVTVDISKLKK